ncbi:glycosyltransferase family 4 protein [Olivibacter sp. CPCC 100613]|uniref:glycosyltransferase family 4 protein n=1 Tax=Olivibacter sp. CPCC 100613 TaxID=3079931 RepID=UPI002FF911F3
MEFHNKKPKAILFFFPFFGYSGSEIMLFEFLKGLDRSKFVPYLYLFEKGSLIQELPSDITYFLPYKKTNTIKDWVIRKSIRKKNENHLIHQLKSIQKKIGPCLWYLNTIAINPKVYEIANYLNVKIVTHVHELPYAYTWFPKQYLKNILTYSNHCVVCSKAVQNSFGDIGFSNTSVVHNFIDTDKIKNSLKDQPISREGLGIQRDEFIWLISGHTNYWKGIQYLPEILKQIGTEKMRIIWVGRELDNAFCYYIKLLLDEKYPGKVIFAGSQTDNYYKYFAISDGFLILSLQESFSLVALEATYFNLPIVSFEYGAAQEILANTSAQIIDSFDINCFIQAMKKIMQIQKIGAKKELNQNISSYKSKQIARFNQVIEELVG